MFIAGRRIELPTKGHFCFPICDGKPVSLLALTLRLVRSEAKMLRFGSPRRTTVAKTSAAPWATGCSPERRFPCRRRAINLAAGCRCLAIEYSWNALRYVVEHAPSGLARGVD